MLLLMLMVLTKFVPNSTSFVGFGVERLPLGLSAATRVHHATFERLAGCASTTSPAGLRFWGALPHVGWR